MGQNVSDGTDEFQLIYFTDPMCSWCYGFAPVMASIADEYADRAPLRLVMGGLRAYQTAPLSDADKTMIRKHWTEVARRSGQPFDFAFFDRTGFVYDTEPACRAVVIARETRPGSERGLLKAIQSAFYADNRDVTNLDELASIAGAAGFDASKFRNSLNDEAMTARTRVDFLVAQKSGVKGFPTLIAGRKSTGFHLVCGGYSDLEGIAVRLDQLMIAA